MTLVLSDRPISVRAPLSVAAGDASRDFVMPIVLIETHENWIERRFRYGSAQSGCNPSCRGRTSPHAAGRGAVDAVRSEVPFGKRYRRMTYPVSRPSQALNQAARRGGCAKGSMPCQASNGVRPSRFWCGRTMSYQTANRASARANSPRSATLHRSSFCLSVPNRRSIRPFCQGQPTSLRWWRMPSRASAARKRREVNTDALSVRKTRGLPNRLIARQRWPSSVQDDTVGSGFSASSRRVPWSIRPKISWRRPAGWPVERRGDSPAAGVRHQRLEADDALDDPGRLSRTAL